MREDTLHRPGCVQWHHCDGCLGYRTRHWPEAEGLRCEGCHRIREEKVAQDPEQEKVAPDEYDPIPWFTDQHAREAAQRMKAWASGAGHVPQLAASVLTDAEWLNLARVCLELRPR